MSKLITIIISFVAGAIVTSAIAYKAFPNIMIHEIESQYTFEETLENIEVNAKAKGWKVPKKWKVNLHKNMLKVVKVDIGPNTLIKMCEPKAAADILIHNELKRLSSIMPCTISVYVKTDGKTYIGYMNMQVLGLLFGEKVEVITDELGPQMDDIVARSAAK